MKRIAHHLLIFVLVFAVLSAIWMVVRSKLQQQAQRKRDAAYQATLLSFTEALKPGMTRKEVEDYFRAKNLKFIQMCCVDSRESASRSSWDDLTKIGEEQAPWFCSEKNIYVAFQFTDHKARNGTPKTDDLDTLRAVSIYRWLEGCL
jgi:Na+-transporting NADH:ubiquinone oxidoreductase subunit NqrC